MNIRLLCMGDTKEDYLNLAISKYLKRISPFVKFNVECISTPKIFSKIQGKELQKKESELFLKHIHAGDQVILLDENGKNYNSEGFAGLLQNKMNTSTRSLVFIIGGANGFSDVMKKQFSQHMALSKMTFSHQLIRLLFIEQLYRAFTIINNHPYHNP